MKENPETEFENLFASTSKVTAPAELRARAESAARLHQTISDRSSLPRRRLVLATGSAFALVAAFVVLPIVSQSASLVSKSARALRGVKSIHAQSYLLVNGRRTPEGQVWYANDNWRVEDRWSVQIYSGDTKWSRATGATTVLEQQRQPGEMPESMENGVRVQEAFAQLNSGGMKFHIEYGPEQTESGRHWRSIIATRPGHNERDVFQVDLATDLPFTAEHDVLVGGEWQPNIVAEFAFNGPVDASEFKPDFGSDVRVVNMNDLRQGWITKLSSTPKGALDLKAEGSDNLIRDVFVNSKGWVFVLWTGKMGDRDHRLTLTDNNGNAYSRAAFNPGSSPHEGSKLPLLSVDGEVVDGAWFVPVEDVDPSTVTRYELAATRLKVEGANDTARGEWFNRPWETMPVAAPSGQGGHYTLLPLGKISFGKPAVSAALLPEYSPLFQDAPTTNLLAEVHAVNAREWYWMARFGGGFATNTIGMANNTPAQFVVDGPLISEPQIVMPSGGLESGKYDPTALQKVAGLVTKRLELTRNFDPSGEGSSFDQYDLSVVNRALGNVRAADEELATARRNRSEINWGSK